jgi:tripartite-type tricarboxylate transporter receptor subunit TctC
VNTALRESLRDPGVASKFAELGAQIVPESKQTPAALRDWLQAEINKWGPVIRKAGNFAD